MYICTTLNQTQQRTRVIPFLRDTRACNPPKAPALKPHAFPHHHPDHELQQALGRRRAQVGRRACALQGSAADAKAGVAGARHSRRRRRVRRFPRRGLEHGRRDKARSARLGRQLGRRRDHG